MVVTTATLSRSESWHASLSRAFELACAAPPRRRIDEVHDEHACILCTLCKCCIVRMLLWGLLASFTAMQGQLKTRNASHTGDRCARTATRCRRKVGQGKRGVDEAVRQARHCFDRCTGR